MEEGGSFIFCVSDFSQASFSAFQTMKEKAEYTDVTIRCNGRTFLAHRVVLAARIPHFRNIFSSQGSEISLDKIDPDILESLISFAYEGKLKVTAENVSPMLMATAFFQLDRICKACWEFLSKTPASSNDLGGTHACIKLVPSDHNIRENFDEFCNTEEFLFLPYSSLKDLVSRNDLKVESEEKVFEAVMKWIKMSPTERQHLLPYLLTKIRMANLTPDYLVEKVATEEMVRSSDPCKHILEEAKSYHLLPNKRSMFLSFNTDSRLYEINTHRTPSRNDNSSTSTHESVPYGSTLSTAPNPTALLANSANSTVTHESVSYGYTTSRAPNPSTSRVNYASNTTTHDNVAWGSRSTAPNPSASRVSSTSSAATHGNVACRNTMSGAPKPSASRVNSTSNTDTHENVACGNIMGTAPNPRASSVNSISNTVTHGNLASSNTMSGAPKPRASRINSTRNAATHENVARGNIISTAPNPPASSVNSISNTVTHGNLASSNTMSGAPKPSASRVNSTSNAATLENVACGNIRSTAPNPRASSVNSINNTATHGNLACCNTMSGAPNPTALHLNSTSNTAAHASVAYRNTMSTAPNQSASRVNVTTTTTSYNVSNQNSCSYKIEDGIYAVCCTDSETLVGYFDNQNKKWDCFQTSTRVDDVVGVTLVNDQLCVFFTHSVEIFHLRNHEWTSKQPTPGSIRGSGIVCYMESIYIFGGFYCNTKIRRFNPRQNKWIPDGKMNHGRRNMGVASYLGKYICLTGGFTTSCCRSVEKYNPITKEWSQMPDMLLDRMDHGCASLNDKIYVCGGRFNGTHCMNTAEVYDGVSDQWTSIPPIKIARYFLSLVPWNGKLYAFGGRTKKKTCLRRLEVFNPENNKWASDVYVSTLSQEKCPVVVKVLKVVSTVVSRDF